MRYLLKYKCYLLVFFILINCSKDEYYEVNEVVLTFDDAPFFPEHTGQILDILKKHHVQATFFCVGEGLDKYPELAHRISTEQFIGNHTYSHINIENSDLTEIYDREILQTQHLIDSLQPFNKHYFRPPYGSLSSQQNNTLLANGFDVVWWDLSAEEWDEKVSTKNVLDYFHANLNSNVKIPIILFHLSKSTVDALEILLTEFEENKISVITLDDYKRR